MARKEFGRGRKGGGKEEGREGGEKHVRTALTLSHSHGINPLEDIELVD